MSAPSSVPPKRYLSPAERQQALVELGAFVRQYEKHNRDFRDALDARHARWERQGLLRPVPRHKTSIR